MVLSPKDDTFKILLSCGGLVTFRGRKKTFKTLDGVRKEMKALFGSLRMVLVGV